MIVNSNLFLHLLRLWHYFYQIVKMSFFANKQKKQSFELMIEHVWKQVHYELCF